MINEIKTSSVTEQSYKPQRDLFKFSDKGSSKDLKNVNLSSKSRPTSTKKKKLITHVADDIAKKIKEIEPEVNETSEINYCFKFKNDKEFYNGFVKKFYTNFKVEKKIFFDIIGKPTALSEDKIRNIVDVSNFYCIGFFRYSYFR